MSHRGRRRDRAERDRDDDRHRDSRDRDRDRGRDRDNYRGRDRDRDFRDRDRDGRDRGGDRRQQASFDDPNYPTQVPAGLSENDSLRSRFRQLVVLIGGESSQARIDQNLDKMAMAIDKELEGLGDSIFKVLFDCVLNLPHKTSIYGTLVGLVNVRKPVFGETVVHQLRERLNDALLQGKSKWRDIRILVRFLGELVNAGVVRAIHFINLVEQLLSAVEQERPMQEQVDSVFYVILSALPWVGHELNVHHPDEVADLMDKIERYMSSRTYQVHPLLLVRPNDLPPDSLNQWYQGVKAMESDGWVAKAPPRPYTAFTNRWSRSTTHPFALHAIPPLAGTGGQLPPVVMPVFESELQQRFKLIDTLVIQEWVADLLDIFVQDHTQCAKLLLQLPLDNDCGHIITEVLISEIFKLPRSTHRQIYYVDIFIDLFKLQPKMMPPLFGLSVHNLFENIDTLEMECRDRFVSWFAFHLSNFGFSWPWPNWEGVTRLPPHDPRYVFVQEVLSACVRLSYSDRVRKTIPDAFVPLMPANPLPRFKYANKPASASAAAPSSSSSSSSSSTPSASSSDSASMELESTSTPSSDTPSEPSPFDILPAPTPTPTPTPSASDPTSMAPESKDETETDTDPNKPSFTFLKELASGMLPFVQQKRGTMSMMYYLDQKAGNLSEPARLDLLMSCILHVGAVSFSHLFRLVESSKDVFKRFAPTLENQHAIISAVFDFWSHSHQHTSLILQKLLHMHVIEAMPLVQFVLNDRYIPLMHRAMVWEIVQNTLNKSLDRLTHARSAVDRARMSPVELVDRTRNLDELERLAEQQQREVRELLLWVFTRFAQLLTSIMNQPDMETGHNFLLDAVESRAKQFGRLYAIHLQPLLTTLENQAYNDVDSRIQSVFLMIKTV
eukprot:TRINITY_DN1308_c0_g1_i5.p1 TRINITY_DN1308_c0_g1~~TRINITY_DN1308_c0_g1_i5.p1  ORF type:complete len:896 (+),score=243.22 TRINITY_DN1308_c0_g1_i5:62-2749(+)